MGHLSGRPRLELITRYRDAGYDRVFIQQVGSDQAGFFELFAREVWPALGA